MSPFPYHVFGIGLGRTGRGSLTKALNDLGVRARHVNDDQALQRQLLAGRRDLPYLDRYQAILGGIAPFFRELDRLIPNSRFILTVRDRDDWLAERERMAALEAATFTRLDADDRAVIEAVRTRTYGSAAFEPARYLEVYDRHVADVRAYFGDRFGDLLVMNIPGGDGFEVLCPFLGKAVPDTPFPHRNDWAGIAARHARASELWSRIEPLLPAAAPFILIDGGELGCVSGRALPFLERDGRPWGAPPDDATAIRELERMRAAGAAAVVFTPAAFWWCEHYAGFCRHLRDRYAIVVEREDVAVFALDPPGEESRR